MNALRSALSTVPALFLSSIFLQACSNPPVMRQLLSVAITPESGTATGSPAQVEFVATGTYNTEPYTVTPLAATWGVSGLPEPIASTTQNGQATCSAGVSGTTTIEAWVQIEPSVCNIIDGAGRPGCGNVFSSAQLTCP